MARPLLPISDVPTLLRREIWRAKASARRARMRGVAAGSLGCPRCGEVFGGLYPLRAYAGHRATPRCPWRAGEERVWRLVMLIRRRSLAASRFRARYVPTGRPPGRPPALNRPSARRHRRAQARTVAPAPIPAPHTGHELFDQARALVDGPAYGSIVQDLRSEVVLALLEGRDPQVAIRAQRAQERLTNPRMGAVRSLDAPMVFSDGDTRSLHDVIAGGI